MPWGYGSAAHGTAGVGTATGTAVPANDNRKYLLLINDSDTTMYLSLDGGAAVVNEGIRVNSGGSSYGMSFKGGDLFTGVITAIHGGTGTKKLLYTEGV
jgi:hypothetical protein